jgi:hypothetical protein
VGRLFRRESFKVAKLKDISIWGLKVVDGCGQDSSSLVLRVTLLGVRRWILDLNSDRAIIGFFGLVDRDFARVAPSNLHQRFVDRNAHEPSVKA